MGWTLCLVQRTRCFLRSCILVQPGCSLACSTAASWLQSVLLPPGAVVCGCCLDPALQPFGLYYPGSNGTSATAERMCSTLRPHCRLLQLDTLRQELLSASTGQAGPASNIQHQGAAGRQQATQPAEPNAPAAAEQDPVSSRCEQYAAQPPWQTALLFSNKLSHRELLLQIHSVVATHAPVPLLPLAECVCSSCRALSVVRHRPLPTKQNWQLDH